MFSVYTCDMIQPVNVTLIQPQGAIIGGVLGLAVTMWIAVGANILRPYDPILNMTTSGCPDNITLVDIDMGNHL